MVIKKGFSLIELLIVIGILGVVMAVVVPNVGKFGDANLVNQAAQNLVTDLELVKIKALSGSYHENNKANWGVNICDDDSTGNTYTLKGYDFVTPTTTYDDQVVTLSSGISIDCSSSYSGDIVFERFKSTPTGGNDITIIIGKGNNERRQITIDGVSGKITIQDLP